MSYKIVVMSCDKNKDLWKPFYLCMEKYWKNHPEIIYSTETLENPYYKTICRNIPIDKWTLRVKETIKNLPCKHILLMVDDIFIREKVDNNLIWNLQKLVEGNIASLNFEKSFDNEDIPYLSFNSPLSHYTNILIRNMAGRFKLSLMCQMWKKKYMLKLFSKAYDPWTFEKKNEHKNYAYLISRNGDFIKWGRNGNDWKFGIVKGKWTKECKDFFDKEGISDIDYSIRGFIDE